MTSVRDEDRDEGRIEIELVEDAPPRRWARRDGGVHAAGPTAFPPQPQGGEASGGPDTEAAERGPAGRRATMAIAGGLGVAGLLVGWVVGRADRDTAAATPAAETLVAGTTPRPSFADDPALVEPDAAVISEPAAPRTTRPRPSTTTVPLLQEVSPIPGLDPALAGLPYEIVTGDVGGNLRYLDLATSTLTTVHSRRGIDTFYVGDGWVILPNGAPRANVIYDGDPEPVQVPFYAWSVMHATGSETLWQPDASLEATQMGTMIEIDETGTPTGREVDLPRYPTSVDADGTFVVDGPGGVYLVSDRGIARLTAGEIVALGPTIALVHECDPALVCEYATIDRATGARHALPALSVPNLRIDPVAWWTYTDEAVSPDGELAMVFATVAPEHGSSEVTESELVVVDLDSGEMTAMPDIHPQPWMSGVSWTADSRFAFFMSDGEVLAWSRETGEVLRAGHDETSTQRPQTFRVRPSSGTPWRDR